MPSVVAIRLVQVEMWYILIFNVRRRIRMIILLQFVTIQIRRLFWHISYYKVQQSNFITKCDRLLLKSVWSITKCEKLLLQSASGITKCDRLYYKARQVLQSVTIITKSDVTEQLQSHATETSFCICWWSNHQVLYKRYYLLIFSSCFNQIK